MKIKSYHKICFVLFAIFISNVLYSMNADADHTPKVHFEDGDILLQHLPSHLSSVIADVTNSQYSHCGIVVHRNGQPYVIEAIGPVLFTPVKKWIDRGISGRFTQLRPNNLTPDQIKKVIDESKKLLGKPYDIQYELDEDKIDIIGNKNNEKP